MKTVRDEVPVAELSPALKNEYVVRGADRGDVTSASLVLLKRVEKDYNPMNALLIQIMINVAPCIPG